MSAFFDERNNEDSYTTHGMFSESSLTEGKGREGNGVTTPSQGEGFHGAVVSTTEAKPAEKTEKIPFPGSGRSPVDRMLGKVEIITETGCWIFMGALSSGYGTVSSPGPRGTAPEGAHRLSYQHFNGPIPDGLFVCHRCDIRCCCNPHHLFFGTQHVNNTDMANKGRSSRGEDRPLAKLTEEIVRSMRTRHAAGESISSLARQIGVSVATARKAIRGLKWRHV